jgi:hypothetical protein
MEAIGEFIADQAQWAGPVVDSLPPRLARLAAVAGAADAAGEALNGTVTGPGKGTITGAADLTAGDAVDLALAVLRFSGPAACAEADRFGLLEAADFAGRVEDLSRTMEYLQLVAAGGGPDPQTIRRDLVGRHGPGAGRGGARGLAHRLDTGTRHRIRHQNWSRNWSGD